MSTREIAKADNCITNHAADGANLQQSLLDRNNLQVAIAKNFPLARFSREET